MKGARGFKSGRNFFAGSGDAAEWGRGDGVYIAHRFNGLAGGGEAARESSRVASDFAVRRRLELTAGAFGSGSEVFEPAGELLELPLSRQRGGFCPGRLLIG